MTTTITWPNGKVETKMEASGTAPTLTAEELRSKLAELEQTEQAEKAAQAEQPVLDQVKAADGNTFLDKLRTVAADLKEAGKIGEQDIVAAGDDTSINATLFKLVGEIVDKL